MKTILILITLLVFSGCGKSEGYTISDCIDKGYSGIVLSKQYREPWVKCSNGVRLNEKYFTNMGEESTVNYMYFKFEETK